MECGRNRRSDRKLKRVIASLQIVLLATIIFFIGALQAESVNAEESDQAREILFDIWEFRVAGNSILERKDIELTLYPYLGRHKSSKTVTQAKEALQERYRQDGYHTVIVEIPEQTIKEGIVRLKVIEGRVGRLRVTESDYFLLSRIKQEVPSLKEGGVPHMPTVQQELGMVNSKTPDRRVVPIMRPGRRSGTIDVDLKVKDELPVHGDIELNDRYSGDTEKLRLSASVRYTNLWQKEHAVSFQYQTAPEDLDQISIASLTYMFRQDKANIYNVFYAVNSKTGIATLGDFGQSLSVNGNGNILGYRRIYPFTPKDGFSQSLTVGADYKDFMEAIESNLSTGSSSSSAISETPIDYLTFALTYNASQHWKRGETGFNISTIFGVRGLVNEMEEFENKRFHGQPNFLIFKGGIEHSGEIWGGASVTTSVGFQLADSPLVSNERFSAGGVSTVRGYLESQISGDDAFLYTTELRSPSLGSYISDHIDEWTFALFLDAAYCHEQDSLPDLDGNVIRDFEIFGAGLNMEFAAWKALFLSLNWATPLKDNGDIEKGDSRTHFSLKYAF